MTIRKFNNYSYTLGDYWYIIGNCYHTFTHYKYTRKRNFLFVIVNYRELKQFRDFQNTTVPEVFIRHSLFTIGTTGTHKEPKKFSIIIFIEKMFY